MSLFDRNIRIFGKERRRIIKAMRGKIDFPYCAKTCDILRELGAMECERVCPSKFKGGRHEDNQN